MEISAGIYTVRTRNYYTATSALYDFYIALQECYNNLCGKATYSVRCPENDLVFEVKFNKKGSVYIEGKYQDNPPINNVLYFEFDTDQSYFKEVLSDLKKVFLIFDDRRGAKQ